MILNYTRIWLILFGSLRIIFGSIVYWREFGIGFFSNIEKNVKPFKRSIGSFTFIIGVVNVIGSFSLNHFSSVLICLIVSAIELFQLHNEFFAYKSLKSKQFGYDMALCTLFTIILLSYQLLALSLEWYKSICVY